MALTLNIGSAAPALVQSAAVSASLTMTLPSPSTAGTALVATVANSGSDAPGLSFPVGWSQMVAEGSGGGLTEIEIWIYPNNPGGISVVTASGASVFYMSHISEWSGVAAASVKDVSGVAVSSSGTTLALTTTGNVLAANEVAIAAWRQRIGATAAVTFTTPAGWTRLADNGSDATQSGHLDVEYRLNPASGAALSATLTSGTTTVNAVGVILVLKRGNPVVDQTAFIRYGSLTIKLNTLDVSLVDPATVPSLGDPVALTTPTWNGRVVSVMQSDIVDIKSGHKLVTITATNQTTAGATTAPFDLSDVPSGIATRYAATVLADAPAGYWRFGETSGNAADSSGNGFTGTSSVITYSQAGALVDDADTSYSFNGTTSNVSVPHQAALQPGDVFSLECWFKRTAVTNLDCIFGTTTNGYALRVQNTVGIVFSKDGVSNPWISVNASDGADTNWHHLVFTKNGATMACYLDGVALNGTVANATILTTAAVQTIGLNSVGHFTGLLDEVAIYGTALSAAQVLNHYQAGHLGPLIGYQGLAVKTTQNIDGTTAVYGNLTVFTTGLAPNQTFKLTSSNLGYSAQSFLITNVTQTFHGLQQPAYMVEFGDPYLSLQLAGAGVLTKQGSQASIQQGVQMGAGTLGYVPVTAAQSGITTVTDLTGLTVTITAGTGRRLKITGRVDITSTVATDTAQLNIQEGGSILDSVLDGSNLATHTHFTAIAVVTPTAGVHTYKLTASRAVGTGSLTIQNGTTTGFILVEDIGT